jgi:hypothetical protein
MRPIGVKLLAVYFTVLAMGSLALPVATGMSGAPMASAPVASGAVYAATAVGLWMCWGWARVAAIVINGISALSLFARLFETGAPFSERAWHFGLALALVATCLYMVQKDTRDQFRTGAARRS